MCRLIFPCLLLKSQYDKQITEPIKLTFTRDWKTRPNINEVAKYFSEPVQKKKVKIIEEIAEKTEDIKENKEPKVTKITGKAKTATKEVMTRGRVKMKTTKVYKIDKNLMELIKERPLQRAVSKKEPKEESIVN